MQPDDYADAPLNEVLRCLIILYIGVLSGQHQVTCQLLFVFQAPIDVPAWEHKLQYAYWLWFSRRSPGKQASVQNYDQNLKLIGRFASVEQFWALYSHLVRPSDLQSHSDFHLFKVGIKPMWEVSSVLAISSLLSFCKEKHAATPVSFLYKH
jgi:hypothetical protein